MHIVNGTEKLTLRLTYDIFDATQRQKGLENFDDVDILLSWAIDQFDPKFK